MLYGNRKISLPVFFGILKKKTKRKRREGRKGDSLIVGRGRWSGSAVAEEN